MKNGSYQHHIIWKKKVWPKLRLVVTSRHSMPPFATRCTNCCHSLSLVITCCTTRCHSLLLDVPLVATRWTTCCHSLLLAAIRCHSLYHSLSFIVTRCTTLCHSLSLDVPLVCLFIIDLLPNISRCKGNQSMKLGQVIQYNKRHIFL